MKMLQVFLPAFDPLRFTSITHGKGEVKFKILAMGPSLTQTFETDVMYYYYFFWPKFTVK